MWYIFIMKFYSAIKSSELQICAKAFMNLKNVLNETSLNAIWFLLNDIHLIQNYTHTSGKWPSHLWVRLTDSKEKLWNKYNILYFDNGDGDYMIMSLIKISQQYRYRLFNSYLHKSDSKSTDHTTHKQMICQNVVFHRKMS